MRDIACFKLCDHSVDGIQYSSPECPRCRGENYYLQEEGNDLVIQKNNIFYTMSGTQRMKNWLLKALLTELNNYPSDEKHGTTLYQEIGQKFTSRTIVEFKDQVINVMTRYNQFNRGNPNPDEIIDSLESIDIDPKTRGFSAKLKIRTMSKKITEIDIDFSS